MAQGLMDRLTYERLGVILTDAPAYKESGSKYKDLIRVQNMSYDLTHQSIDIKAIGSDKLVTRDGQSPVVRAPDISCDIGYLFTHGLNENSIGFHLGEDGSVLKNFLLQNHTDDINVLIVSSSKNDHEDLAFLQSESDFENFNIIGIGNAFLSRYAYSASVGQFASSVIAYGGSNIQFDLYSSQNRPRLPAIKLGVDNVRSNEILELSPDKFADLDHAPDRIFDSHVFPEISAIAPGTITATIFKISGDKGGAILDSVHAAVQNINIDLPIPRQEIYGLGSNFIFDKKLKLPIIGSLSVDMVLREYSQDQLDGFLNKTNTYDIKIDHKIHSSINGDSGDFFADDLSEKFYINIGDAQWKATSIGQASIEENSSRPLNEEEYISEQEDFYHVKIKGSTWLKIPLEASDFTLSGSSVLSKFYQNDYIHIKTDNSFRKFAVIDVVVDNNLIQELSFDSAIKIVNNITFEINNAQLQNQSYTHEIGSDVMVSSSLSFGVTKDNGLKLYPRFIPRNPPDWSSGFDSITHDENDTSALNYNKILERGDSKVSFSIGGADEEYFEVHPDGNIFFLETPDFETKSAYSLSITATNEAGSSLKNIDVQIIDKNDSNPLWNSIEEVVDHLEGETLVNYDQSLNIDSAFSFYGLSGEDKKYFSLSSSGQLSFKFAPDYETATKKTYNLFITAFNEFGNTDKSLTINLINQIDSSPEWQINSQDILIERSDLSNLNIIGEIKEFQDQPVSYSISGQDSSLFEISSNGDISFIGDANSINKTSLYFEAQVSNAIGSDVKQINIKINQIILIENSRVVFENDISGERIQIGAAHELRILPAYQFREDYSVMDFAYFAAGGYSWAKIPLLPSELNSQEGLDAYQEGDKIFIEDYVHIYTNIRGWMKTAIIQ